MKRIVLFGAGKSATCLIDYLIRVSAMEGWELVVADGNLQAASEKVAGAGHAMAIGLNVNDVTARQELVSQGDIIISLLPPSLHSLVATDCLKFGKNLLTASYVDEKIAALRSEIERKRLLFLCETGLDPGIDHMSAMELVHRIHSMGGRVRSFKSHTGGLVAPESDDNPWHYKISWNPRNVVLAGKAGAIYKWNDRVVEMAYANLFDDCPEISIPGLGQLAYYPNRDSLGYIPLYSLEEASTFLRTTLRYPSFCDNWRWIVRAGLTDEFRPLDPACRSLKQWSGPILPWVNDANRKYFSWLGFFDDAPLPAGCASSADVLQHLLETRLAMRPGDKDMIVMLHELEYENGGDLKKLSSLLLVKGEDHVRTAMAKTVGLPLGIAARLILRGEINLTGLHIPTHPSIYEPVLRELAGQGIAFREWSN